MSEKFYRQCELVQVNGTISVCWIPEQFAVPGKWLRIKKNDHWENGWKVGHIYGRESESNLIASERDYLRQRAVSDV